MGVNQQITTTDRDYHSRAKGHVYQKSDPDVKLTVKEKFGYPRIIWFYRKHPCIAARDLLGVRLAPHQRIVLKAIWSKPNVALVMSRGMSKTFILGLIAVLRALLFPGMKVLAASGQTFRQGQMILEECENILLAKNKEIADVPFGKVSFGKYIAGVWKVLTRGQDSWGLQVYGSGSTIKTFPMSNADKIRGYRAHLILLDERNAVSDEVVQKVISPFANVKRGVLTDVTEESQNDVDNTFVHAGTIEYTWQGFAKLIRGFLKKNKEKNIVIEFNYEDGYGYGINWEKIEEDRDSGEYDFAAWAAENKNQLQEDAENYFGSKLIFSDGVFEQTVVNEGKKTEKWISKEVYKYQEKKKPCYMGIDPARQSDEFAITIIVDDKDEGCIYPIYQQTWKKAYFKQVVDKIFSLINDRYNIIRIGLDQGGGGFQVRDLFMEPENKKYKPIYDPSDEHATSILGPGRRGGKPLLRLLKPNAERNTMWNSNLKKMLQTGQFKFTDLIFVPRLPDKDEEAVLRSMIECKRQFVHIKTKVSVHNNMSFYADSGKKDLYSSTLYAAAVYQDHVDERKMRGHQEELATGFWA